MPFITERMVGTIDADKPLQLKSLSKRPPNTVGVFILQRNERNIHA